MVKIKICGITNPKDAEAAIALGADAIGFVFADSPRQVIPDIARSIAGKMAGKALFVGVFVNETKENVARMQSYCRLNAIQLHGDEPPEYCGFFKDAPVIKTFRVKDKDSIAEMRLYKDVFAYLVDTYSEKSYGGTGRTFDWDLAAEAKSYGKPLILSGGLNCGNISQAIKTVRPYGVDISSSIESSPGKKDHGLMREIIRIIKALD